jgi:hypothetical protein
MSEEDKKTFNDENSGPAFYLMMMILFGVLSIVFLCMIWCGKKSLQRAIDVIDASADFIAHNKRVIVVPITTSSSRFSSVPSGLVLSSAFAP